MDTKQLIETRDSLESLIGSGELHTDKTLLADRQAIHKAIAVLNGLIMNRVTGVSA